MSTDPLEAFDEIVERFIREEETQQSVAAVLAANRRTYLAETPEPVGNPNAALHEVRVDVAQVFGGAP